MQGSRKFSAGALLVTLVASLLGVMASPALAVPPGLTAIPNPAYVDGIGNGSFKLEVRDGTANGTITVVANDLGAPAGCATVVQQAANLNAFGADNVLIWYQTCGPNNSIQVNVTDNASGTSSTITVPLNDPPNGTAGSPAIILEPTGQGTAGSDNRVSGEIRGSGWTPGTAVALTANNAAGNCTNLTFYPTGNPVPDSNGNFVTGFVADTCNPNTQLTITGNDGTRSRSAVYNVLPPNSATQGTPGTPPAGGAERCDNNIDDNANGQINEGCAAHVTPPAGEICGDALDNNGNGLINEGCAAAAADGSISGDTTSSGGFSFLCGFLASFPGCAPTSTSGVTVTAVGPETGSDTSAAGDTPDYTIAGLTPGTYTVTATTVSAGGGFFSIFGGGGAGTTVNCTSSSGATSQTAVVNPGATTDVDWTCPSGGGGLFGLFGGLFGGGGFAFPGFAGFGGFAG